MRGNIVMIKPLDMLAAIGTVSPDNTSGTWSTYRAHTDPAGATQLKINEIIDALNMLMSNNATPKAESKSDYNLMMDIIKENNKQWMDLLRFMKDGKDIPKIPDQEPEPRPCVYECPKSHLMLVRTEKGKRFVEPTQCITCGAGLRFVGYAEEKK